LQLLKRALIHGDSTFTVDGCIVSNSMFLSQQLQAWLRLLTDEYWHQYVSAATAIRKFHPSLNLKRETIEAKLFSIKRRSAKILL
jgi:hypothetical protein